MNTDKYIQACLSGVLSDIENAPQSMANDTLNLKAFRLYQVVGANQLDEQYATQLLEQSADKRGIPKAEVRDTLKSAKKGMKDPKPFGNLENLGRIYSGSVANEFDDLEALEKQKKSLEWYERIKGNQPASKQPYLVKKKLTEHRDMFFSGEDRKGKFLAYPLYNCKGKVCGFGRVYGDGEKRNTAGCGATGEYYSPFLADIDSETAYITEGAADACSIMAATGCDAYAAISSGTMKRVAELFKHKYKQVICCLDNDNAGRDVGNKLIDAGFKCVIPNVEGQDFSDVFIAGGSKAVNEQLLNQYSKPEMKADTATILNLDQFAITNIEEMRSMLANDNWVLDRLALMGQITIIFAKPNSGKTLITLRMLIDSVKGGSIAGEDIYYLNSDDTLRGLTTKAELAAQYGIKMLASGYNGFKNSHLSVMLEQLTTRDEAKGKVLILDTLKKFSDLMNKTESSAFNEIMRGFVSKGGTVIALAHTNKARDAEGKVIFQGTSDTVDDADCCYTLDVVNSVDDSFRGTKMTTKTVLFENFKARGDNTDKVSYQYTKIEGEPYIALLESVKPVDELEAVQAEKRGRIERKLAEHAEEIQLILDAITSSIRTTEKIIAYLMNEGISRSRAKKVLKEHSGDCYHEGHRWNVERGEKNERLYRALR
ncbi:toprim domain-containing protein [Vibrio sp.]|nr:toprim domain-containing protein [Vibrio sp.]